MNVKKTLDEEIRALIQERLEKIRNPEASDFVRLHPDYPETRKERDRQDIIQSLQQFESIHQKILPHICDLRKLIKDMTERTMICAIYLLFGKMMQTLEVIFLLAKEGRNQEVGELVRSVNENCDLISLFILNSSDEYLNKWFDGEIIEHAKAREAIHKFLNRLNLQDPVSKEELPVYEVSTYIYRVFSKYTHSSYAALLDSVDVFNKDFDFHRFAGYHYIKRNFHIIRNAMVETLLRLKTLYLALSDNDNYLKVDNILKEIMPTVTEEEIKNILEKFTQKKR